MARSPAPGIAAALSFALPGLGQLALGDRRRGLAIAAPAALAFTAIAWLAVVDRSALLEAVLRPEVLIGLLVANALAALYHAAAIVDAFARAVRRAVLSPRARTVSTLALAATIALTLAVHGLLEALTYQVYETATTVLGRDPGDGWAIPDPSEDVSPAPTSGANGSPPPPSPTASTAPTPSPSPSPTPTPSPSPAPKWANDGRLDLLLIGSDAGPDRWSLRTDTMVVLSIEVETGRAALFGIPRNLVDVPLPPESAGAFRGGRFPGLLNALYVYAMGHPDRFPGGEARGFRAVSGAIQELVGRRLDGAIVVDLAAFVRLVDATGGLWIDVPERVVDRAYPLEDGSGHIRLDIRPGCQLLDGRLALAYARSRRQDSDYGRMRRQQAVLVAIARQTEPLELLPRVPELLDIARDHLWTTIRAKDLPGLAELAARVETTRVKTVRFVPPTYPSHVTRASIARIHRVVETVFDTWKPGTGGGSGSSASCP